MQVWVLGMKLGGTSFSRSFRFGLGWLHGRKRCQNGWGNLAGARGVTLPKATHPFALFFPSANGRKVSRVFREGERDLRELTRMRCLSRRRKRRRKQSEDWPLVTAHRIFDGDRTMLARASHQVGRTPHSDGTASGDMLCRMKIKPAAELRFDDLVNQPTISITRTSLVGPLTCDDVGSAN